MWYAEPANETDILLPAGTLNLNDFIDTP